MYKKWVRYVVGVNTWNASTDCMVLKEPWIYGLNVPCLACLYSLILECTGVACRPVAD